MAKAYEISVWKPHAGMWSDAMKNLKEVMEIFKAEGVSDIQIMQGHALSLIHISEPTRH